MDETIDSSKKSVKKSSRFKKLKPWITNDLIKLIRERDKTSKKIKKQPFNATLNKEYRDLRHQISSGIKSSKRVYYRSKLNQYQNNPKRFWMVVNELAGRSNKKDPFSVQKYLPNVSNITPDVRKIVADDFNTFFASVGYNLASSINSSGPPIINDADYRQDTVFTLQTVTELDVIRHVYSLRGGSAPGFDGVSADVLKENVNSLSKPLLHIINLSLASGIFPDKFKLAKVFPLYKSNSHKDKNNFRPISLLSAFSKVLEKIVKEQMVDYLNQNQILADCQYGFRKDKNVTDVLFHINKEIFNALI